MKKLDYQEGKEEKLTAKRYSVLHVSTNLVVLSNATCLCISKTTPVSYMMGSLFVGGISIKLLRLHMS